MDTEAAKRRALERLVALMARARDEGTGAMHSPTGELRGVIAGLRTLDADFQRRVARAVATSGGDPEALRAMLSDLGADAGSPDASARPAAQAARQVDRAPPRPPTVQDARGERTWLVAVLIALACAALAAGWLAQ